MLFSLVCWSYNDARNAHLFDTDVCSEVWKGNEVFLFVLVAAMCYRAAELKLFLFFLLCVGEHL